MAKAISTWFAVLGLAMGMAGPLWAQGAKDMGFFITSAGLGKGGDLGGLQGADRHCQALATAAGAGHRTWKAYLSTSNPPVNARDRIGKGPWQNAKGLVIASDLATLHGVNKIDGDNGLDERGLPVPASRHAILTGSREAGRAYPPDRGDRTCGDWTSSGEGTATVGRHDRRGPASDTDAQSWVTAVRTKGCSPAAFTEANGAGLFYCFAAD